MHSSILGAFTTNWSNTYGPTQAFITQFIKGLENDYGEFIDFLLVELGATSTTTYENLSPGPGVLTAEESVENSLNLLGFVKHSWGPWKNKVLLHFLKGSQLIRHIWAYFLALKMLKNSKSKKRNGEAKKKYQFEYHKYD